MKGELNRESIDDMEYLEGGLHAVAKILGRLMYLSNIDHREFLSTLRRDAKIRSSDFVAGMEIVLQQVEEALPYSTSE